MVRIGKIGSTRNNNPQSQRTLLASAHNRPVLLDNRIRKINAESIIYAVNLFESAADEWRRIVPGVGEQPKFKHLDPCAQ